MGFMWDNFVICFYCDSCFVFIGGGVDEIMFGIICKIMDILLGKK